jgi:hypothetical protein
MNVENKENERGNVVSRNAYDITTSFSWFLFFSFFFSFFVYFLRVYTLWLLKYLWMLTSCICLLLSGFIYQAAGAWQKRKRRRIMLITTLPSFTIICLWLSYHCPTRQFKSSLEDMSSDVIIYSIFKFTFKMIWEIRLLKQMKENTRKVLVEIIILLIDTMTGNNFS